MIRCDVEGCTAEADIEFTEQVEGTLFCLCAPHARGLVAQLFVMVTMILAGEQRTADLDLLSVERIGQRGVRGTANSLR